jgi:hypothetical protein
MGIIFLNIKVQTVEKTSESLPLLRGAMCGESDF